MANALRFVFIIPLLKETHCIGSFSQYFIYLLLNTVETLVDFTL